MRSAASPEPQSPRAPEPPTPRPRPTVSARTPGGFGAPRPSAAATAESPVRLLRLRTSRGAGRPPEEEGGGRWGKHAPDSGETEAGACSEGRVSGTTLRPRPQERQSRRGSGGGWQQDAPLTPVPPSPRRPQVGPGRGPRRRSARFPRQPAGGQMPPGAPSFPPCRQSSEDPGIHEIPPGAGTV